MILEAFSDYLQAADPQVHSTDVLARWLWEILSAPPETQVDRVIHTEIILCRGPLETEEKVDRLQLVYPAEFDIENDSDSTPDPYIFCGSSRSGRKLLKSLKLYSQSYEQQKLARWLHELKASDFANKKNSPRQ